MKRLKRPLLLVVTFAVMAGLLWWCSQGVEFAKLRDALAAARWGYVPPAILLGLMVYPIKAWRWKLILGHPKKPPYTSLLSAIMIGFMVNSIFSRIGEIVRAAVLGVKKEMKTATAFASIALERIFDLCVVALFLVVALLCIDPAAAAGETAGEVDYLALIRHARIAMTVAFLCGVAFLVLLRLKPVATTRVVLFTVSWLPKRVRPHIEHFLHSFVEGLNSLKSVRQVAGLFLLSIVHWLFQVVFFFLVGLCFPELGLTFAGALLVFAVIGVGVAAMPTPFYLGVYQAAIRAALEMLGLGARANLVNSYAWLAWAANVPVIIVAGGVFLSREGLSLGDLRARAEAETEHLEEELEHGASALAQESAASASESDSADG